MLVIEFFCKVAQQRGIQTALDISRSFNCGSRGHKAEDDTLNASIEVKEGVTTTEIFVERVYTLYYVIKVYLCRLITPLSSTQSFNFSPPVVSSLTLPSTNNFIVKRGDWYPIGIIGMIWTQLSREVDAKVELRMLLVNSG